MSHLAVLPMARRARSRGEHRASATCSRGARTAVRGSAPREALPSCSATPRRGFLGWGRHESKVLTGCVMLVDSRGRVGSHTFVVNARCGEFHSAFGSAPMMTQECGGGVEHARYPRSDYSSQSRLAKTSTAINSAEVDLAGVVGGAIAWLGNPRPW